MIPDINRNGEAFFKRGVLVAPAQEDYEASIADYTEAIKIDPEDDFAYYYNRGMAFKNGDGYEWTIMDYSQALKLDPKRDVKKES